MSEQTELHVDVQKKKRHLPGWLVKVIFLLLIAASAFGAGAVGMRTYINSEDKTTRIGFEDMGELATQTAYCTEVNVTETSRELWGIKLPFTQSKYIYSYDVVIKAGVDFSAIQWSVTENTIRVKLPDVKVLSCELDLDSFRVYHEAESIFTPITLEDNNEAMAALKESAQENAIANGLLDNARTNAESILRGFFAGAYDLTQYEVVFR